MKKGGFLRNVLDTIRSNQANEKSQSGQAYHHGKATEYGNQFKANHFSLAQVARHGFPENPTALAYDPVQKLACIGTKSGALRIFGRPGVDVWVRHNPEYAVTHIKFIVNQGAIITVTADESIHLWSICGPNLKLQFSQTNAYAISPSQSSCSKANSPTVGSGQLTTGSSLASGSASTLTSGIGSSDFGKVTQIGDPNFLTDHHNHHSNSSHSNTSTIEQSPKYPQILHTLKFQREHITCLHLTLSDKWLYIGTEKGNVHVANVETFELSGYSIAWNKAIELSRKSHPGSIIHLSECPQDTNKILIGYESGCIVLWDLKNKTAEGRFFYTEDLTSLAWHHEGKQFIAAHRDGSLVTWQRSNPRPVNIVHPHAKCPSQTKTQQQQQLQQQFANNPNNYSVTSSSAADPVQSLTSSFARVVNTNTEFYKPINKVDWKTTKHQEQLLILSGGLPYDGISGVSPISTTTHDQQQTPMTPMGAFGSPPNTSSSASPRMTTPIPIGASQPHQLTTANLSTPSTSQSPISPSKSPLSFAANRSASACSRQSSYTLPGSGPSPKDRISRSTSLTVMLGKSITVLEMDDAIIDFITICDNSPYENDTVDPIALIVLLSTDFIVIDLASPTYPSFDSPYPSSQLRDSPLTCIQYLPDCNQDLIPFLYSSTQNVVSHGPKRGFSDKEWPINGGEWGQSMQSYPELVITGHADGSLKFWDISGVNFDLISKIKTSRLFDKPNELSDSIIIPSCNNSPYMTNLSRQAQGKNASNLRQVGSPTNDERTTDNIQSNNNLSESDYFAIEKIEYYPTTKHLVVAGAMSQVILFRLTKKDSVQAPGDLTTIMVESLKPPLTPEDASCLPSSLKQHSLLRTKPTSVVSATASKRGPDSGARFAGFRAELICLTSMIVSPLEDGRPVGLNRISHCCHAPPKITAIALNENNNILAYSNKYGIVLVDITQKCLIYNASLLDLYGTGSINSNVTSSNNNNSRDINIQSYDTSLILQHLNQHHYSTSVAKPNLNNINTEQSTGNPLSPFTMCQQQQSANSETAGGTRGAKHTKDALCSAANGSVDTTEATPLSKSPAPLSAAGNQLVNCSADSQGQQTSLFSSESPPSTFSAFAKTTTTTTAPASNKNLSDETGASKQQPSGTKIQSRFAANSAFQRQLSSQAMMQGNSSRQMASSSAADDHPPPRPFHRQATTSQIGLSSSPASAASAAAAPGTRSMASANQSTDYHARYTMMNSNENNNITGPFGGVLTKRNASKVSSNTNLSTTSGNNNSTISNPLETQQSSSQMNTTIGGAASKHPSDTIGSKSSNCNNNTANTNKNSQDDHYNNNNQHQLHHYLQSHHHKKTLPDSTDSNTLTSLGGDLQHQDQLAAASSVIAPGPAAATTTTGSQPPITSKSFHPSITQIHNQNQNQNQNPAMHSDKFDHSSLTRSRSSSSSSYVHPAEAASAAAAAAAAAAAGAQTSAANLSQTCLESIQCLCFLDASPPSSAPLASSSMASAAAGAPATTPSPAPSSSSAAAAAAAGGGGGTMSSTSGPGNAAGPTTADLHNHHHQHQQHHSFEANKSLGSLDQQQNQSNTARFLALWVGTSRGIVMLVNLTMPDSEDNRVLQLQSVIADPIPSSSIQMVGSILNLSAFFLEPTRNYSPISALNSPHLTHSQASGGSMESDPQSSTSASSAGSSGANFKLASGEAHQNESRHAQFMVIVSEKQARVYQVPAGLIAAAFRNASGPSPSSGGGGGLHHHHPAASSSSSSSAAAPQQAPDSASSYTHQMTKFLSNKTNCLAKCQLSDTSHARKSAVMSWRQPVEGECCLVNYLATGNLIVHSLPHLRPLMDSDFVPETDQLIASSMILARNGHCLYQPSPMEISKFTISTQYKSMLHDMLGTLFTPREMPEMARPNFFKSLFSVASSAASRQSERDELFGESGAGKPSRTVAKHIAGMDKLKVSQGGLASDLLQAREGLDERGEKLSNLEDRTLAMMNQAESYSQAAGQLAQKYKDKKWYQF